MSSTNFTANIAEVSLSVNAKLISTTSAYNGYYLNIYNNYFFTIENPNPNTYFGVANNSFSTLSKNHITAQNMSQGCFQTGKDKSAYFLSAPLNLTITINSSSESYQLTFSYPTTTGSSSAVPPPNTQVFSSGNSKAFGDSTYTQQFGGIYLPYVKYNTDKDKQTDIGTTGVYYMDPTQNKTLINMTFYTVQPNIDKDSKTVSFIATQISGKTLVDGKKKDVFMLLQWSDALNPYSGDDNNKDFIGSGRWLFYSPKTLQNISTTNLLKDVDPNILAQIPPDELTTQAIIEAVVAPKGVPKTNVIGILYFSVLDESLSQDVQINGVVLYDLQDNPNINAICTGLPSFTACK